MTHDPDEPMLNTFTRQKLPHWLTYPIGAESLSRALADVPQFASLKLWFSFDDSMANQHLLKSQDPINILKTELSIPVRAATSLGRHNKAESENWSLTVYPVLKELKSHARDALLATRPPNRARAPQIDLPRPSPRRTSPT
jgi:hypothetical protein